jgi:SAM-dependent methyltransferase
MTAKKEPPQAEWHSRQADMEAWYRGFIADEKGAGFQLAREYEPYAEFLANLKGSILDVGGGIGLVRDYLTPEAHYIVLDPSTYWLNESWANLYGHFPSLQKRPLFVQGFGESMPFLPGTFDVVLAFWSLNHALDAAQCILEMQRVLKPAGRALLVLEDMEPSWRDALRLWWQDRRARHGFPVKERWDWYHPVLRHGRQIIQHKLAGRSWPMQPDHVRITERQLKRYFRHRFAVTRRRWDGSFLRFELEKI